MENASKALIMAGSVLISMIIIGALVFMFNSLRNLKEEEATTEDVRKLAEYNKQIETFNRPGVYGSEVLSVANLIDDYNKRQADLKGYEPITLEIYTTGIAGADRNTIMKENYIGENSYLNITQDFERLEKETNTAKNKTIHGQTIEKLAGLKTVAIVEILNQKGVINVQKELEKIDDEITIYLSKKAELTEFKNKKFQRPVVEYNRQTNRVTKMVFKEVGVD